MKENNLAQKDAIKGIVAGILGWLTAFLGATIGQSFSSAGAGQGGEFIICIYGIAAVGWSFAIVWGFDSFRKLDKEDRKYRRIALVGMALGLSFILLCLIAIVIYGSW